MVTQTRITFDQAALRDLLESPTGPVAQYLVTLATRFTADAKARVGVDTGNLQHAITFRRDFSHPNPFVRLGVFEPGVSGGYGYGYWHHEGTTGGQITVPKKGRYLVWTDRRTGRRIYATRVVRGATPANHYLRDTLTAVGLVVRPYGTVQ